MTAPERLVHFAVWAVLSVVGGCGTDDDIAAPRAPSSTQPARSRIAIPPDTSSITRYDFIHWFRTSDVDNVAFGVMFIDESTERAVYWFWYDQVAQSAHPDPERLTEPSSLPWTGREAELQVAAGFDGSVYWAALLPEKDRADLAAEAIAMYQDRESVETSDPDERRDRRVSHHWIDCAPLHQLAWTIGAARIQEDKIRNSLRIYRSAGGSRSACFVESTGTKQGVKSAYDGWCYSLAPRPDGAFGIKVSWDESFWGRWPYPQPGRYKIQQSRAAGISEEEFARLVQPETYVGSDTRIEKVPEVSSR